MPAAPTPTSGGASTASGEPAIVIVGGGFAGLAAARILGRTRARVTVVDRTNHHLFQPLLYQVATAGLGATDIAAPLRRILRKQHNTTVVLAEATAVDVPGRAVETTAGRIPFDYALVAAGATHSYFGNDGWASSAPGLKTLADALEIRRRILLAYESAEIEDDPARRRALLTFVIVGAGPTGVEMAGAIAEMGRFTLTGDFRRIDPAETRVVLVDAADRVLPPYDPSLSRAATRQLERLGIEVRTSAAVTAVDADGVEVSGERIDAATIVWAAGVQASRLSRSLEAPLDRAGRIQVEPDLSVPGAPAIFAVGDIAAIRWDGDVRVPGVAPAAIQAGRHAARNIERLMLGRSTEPFEYRDKGSLATIGRRAAVAEVYGLRFSGVVAWLAWLLVHLLELVGFRNRASVLLDWAVAYVTYQRAARLIVTQPSAPGDRPPTRR